MTENEQKTLFAEGLLRGLKEPFQIASEFESDTSRLLEIADLWPKDEFVLSEKKRLLEELGESAFLPTKAELAREVYLKASQEKDSDSAEKLYKLYASVMGYIEKPGTNVNVNNNSHNRVLIVKDHGTDSEWAEKLKKQQNDLIERS